MTKLAYLIYFWQGKLKMKQGRLGVNSYPVNFYPVNSELEAGSYPYHTNIPIRPMTVEHGKIYCYEVSQIPEATRLLIEAREGYLKKRKNTKCGDCQYYRPETYGRGTCSMKMDCYGHYDVRYKSDQACLKCKLTKEEEAYMKHDENELYSVALNTLCQFITEPNLPKAKEIKFNGPATIIFWEDGDKTVVKHDGKGRKDKRLGILYAYIKKIYGPGKSYHEVLNDIEEMCK